MHTFSRYVAPKHSVTSRSGRHKEESKQLVELVMDVPMTKSELYTSIREIQTFQAISSKRGVGKLV